MKAPFAPKPLQQPHPPIVIGGQGKKWIMPLVARYADEWNVAVGVTPTGCASAWRSSVPNASASVVRRA